MMRHKVIVYVLLHLTMLASAEARTAEQTALASAKHRGYTAEQTRCFVPLFAQYAQVTRTGRWVAGSSNPRNKRSNIYKHRAYAECGVIR